MFHTPRTLFLDLLENCLTTIPPATPESGLDYPPPHYGRHPDDCSRWNRSNNLVRDGQHLANICRHAKTINTRPSGQHPPPQMGQKAHANQRAIAPPPAGGRASASVWLDSDFGLGELLATSLESTSFLFNLGVKFQSRFIAVRVKVNTKHLCLSSNISID